jgi:hypothetical protein
MAFAGGAGVGDAALRTSRARARIDQVSSGGDVLRLYDGGIGPRGHSSVPYAHRHLVGFFIMPRLMKARAMRCSRSRLGAFSTGGVLRP